MIENTPIAYRNIKLAQNVSIGVFDLLALVWLLGAVVFLSCAVVSYIAFKGKIKRNSVIIEKRSEFDHCRQKLKIRRNIISVLTAAFITAATVFTGSTLADMTKDGLEYRTQNEVYFKDGVKFSVNVLGKTLPDWVNDIAGDDGNVNIAINRVQTSDTKGWVETMLYWS